MPLASSQWVVCKTRVKMRKKIGDEEKETRDESNNETKTHTDQQ